MMGWLVKEDVEQSLTRLAVVLPLASMCFWIPGTIVLGILQLILSEPAKTAVLIILLIGWLIFIVTLWLRAVRVIRKARVRQVSPQVFHRVQIFGIIFFGANLWIKDGSWTLFFQWVLCMDVALATFYISYFLLALLTCTKIPWNAVTGFGFVFLALVFEIRHNPFKGLL
jgi:TM2 domain-containing membrane protein YozV